MPSASCWCRCSRRSRSPTRSTLFVGFLFVLNFVAGMMTPVGVLLFVMCGIIRISMAELVCHEWPFVTLQYGVLLLCLAFPSLRAAAGARLLIRHFREDTGRE